jgi:hypothetical protein
MMFGGSGERGSEYVRRSSKKMGSKVGACGVGELLERHKADSMSPKSFDNASLPDLAHFVLSIESRFSLVKNSEISSIVKLAKALGST